MLLDHDVECSIEEIEDIKKRDGKIGYAKAAKDALLKKETDIEEVTYAPADFDIVLIGTPVWSGTTTPAIRTYLNKYKTDLNKVAFFCTHGGGGKAKTFKAMKEVCGIEPEGTLSVLEKDVKNVKHFEAVEKFVKSLEI